MLNNFSHALMGMTESEQGSALKADLDKLSISPIRVEAKS